MVGVLVEINGHCHLSSIKHALRAVSFSGVIQSRSLDVS
jgi:hypothetical protein